jgi:hypothetical protein
LEERRTQAVYTRRASERNGSDGLGVLDSAAIEKVQTEAWPRATNADELHDALMLIGVMTPEEIHRSAAENADQFVATLIAENRATRVVLSLECGDMSSLSKRGRLRALQNADAIRTFYVASERLPMLGRSIRTLCVSRSLFCLILFAERLGNAPMRFANWFAVAWRFADQSRARACRSTDFARVGN